MSAFQQGLIFLNPGHRTRNMNFLTLLKKVKDPLGKIDKFVKKYIFCRRVISIAYYLVNFSPQKKKILKANVFKIKMIYNFNAFLRLT